MEDYAQKWTKDKGILCKTGFSIRSGGVGGGQIFD